MLSFEIGNDLRMNGLCLGRSVFRDQCFALGEDTAKRSRVSARTRFFKGAPLHGLDCESVCLVPELEENGTMHIDSTIRSNNTASSGVFARYRDPPMPTITVWRH